MLTTHEMLGLDSRDGCRALLGLVRDPVPPMTNHLSAKLPGIVPSVFVDRRHGQRGVMIANEVCDQLGWFFVAGIGGYLVDTVGRLVEAFSSFVYGLRFAFYLKSNCSLSNVSDDHAGMAMWLV